jgi:hypothetical protein
VNVTVSAASRPTSPRPTRAFRIEHLPLTHIVTHTRGRGGGH